MIGQTSFTSEQLTARVRNYLHEKGVLGVLTSAVSVESANDGRQLRLAINGKYICTAWSWDFFEGRLDVFCEKQSCVVKPTLGDALERLNTGT